MKAAEQDRPSVMRGRVHFRIAQRFVRARELVFFDESWARLNMSSLYGRAPVGERCLDTTPQGAWDTATLMGALRLEGVVEESMQLLDGPVNGPCFLDYVRRCLAPSLREGDVLVMDNLSSHKGPAVAEAVREAGAELWFLPPYSPDLNPIEKLWSKVKAWLRRTGARTRAGLLDAIARALRDVDAEESLHYFQSCGYANN